MNSNLDLKAGLKAGGAPVLWERVFLDIIPTMKRLVNPGTHVLEIGYGDGILSYYLSKELGWKITGMDISIDAHELATGNANKFGMVNQINFLYCRPEEIQGHNDPAD